MCSPPYACYFVGTNDCTTRVHETSLSYIWQLRFDYIVGVTNQMGHAAILTLIAKGPFGKAK
jgi:hypothetical protein